MLAELRKENKVLAGRLREAHNVCEEHRDIATASLIEGWIDETERQPRMSVRPPELRLLRPIDRGRDHIRGGGLRSRKVAVVMYGDYLCHY
jgi:hypothetical protein